VGDSWIPCWEARAQAACVSGDVASRRHWAARAAASRRGPALRPLPDAEFVQEVRRRYDAIADRVYREPELLSLVLPTLRADLEALQSYTYAEDAP